MMNRRSICGLTALLAVCVAATAVNASTINTLIGPGVNNGSFESPDLTGMGLTDPNYNYAITNPTGWGNPCIIQDSPSGVHNIASEGDQGIALVSYGGPITGITLTESFQPDTIYTATMDINGNTAPGVGGEWWLADTAGSVVEQQPFASGAAGTGWEAVTPLVVNTATNPEFVGKLIVLGVWNGTANQLWADNVTLTAVPVPEPATFALLATGVMGILVCVRRRKK